MSENKYSWTSARDGVSDQRHALAALCPLFATVLRCLYEEHIMLRVQFYYILYTATRPFISRSPLSVGWPQLFRRRRHKLFFILNCNHLNSWYNILVVKETLRLVYSVHFTPTSIRTPKLHYGINMSMTSEPVVAR
jgi:hypothetical protein